MASPATRTFFHLFIAVAFGTTEQPDLVVAVILKVGRDDPATSLLIVPVTQGDGVVIVVGAELAEENASVGVDFCVRVIGQMAQVCCEAAS